MPQTDESVPGRPPDPLAELAGLAASMRSLISGASGLPVGPCFPELVFGLVRTLGTDSAAVVAELQAQLRAGGYDVKRLKLSSLLTHDDDYDVGADPEARYTRLMDKGDRARQEFGSGPGAVYGGEVLALQAVRKIVVELRPEPGAWDGNSRVAWILDGLMHPDEVTVLRDIYGRRLFLISCDAPFALRVDTLARRLASTSEMSAEDAQGAALRLVHRNAGIDVRVCPPRESGSMGRPVESAPGHGIVDAKFRVAVERAYPLGDAFVRCDDPVGARRVIGRLVESILSHPFHTPTLDELGMAVAYQAAFATASLARRVGAALMKDEQVLAIGCNEVPRTGGGVFHSESEPDGREFMVEGDPSDQTRVEILADTLLRLKKVFELRLVDRESGPQLDLPAALAAALDSEDVRSGKLFDVVEYGRTAHAEIVAITSAARRGISVQDATLYSTTMPCHECTRAIVAAGIRRVVYVEPYTKSRGPVLQAHAVSLVRKEGERSEKVSIEMFSGISHRRFVDLFSWVDRKQADRERATSGTTSGGTGGSSAEEVAETRERRHGGKPVAWEVRTFGVRSSVFSRFFQEEEVLGQALREIAAIKRLGDS